MTTSDAPDGLEGAPREELLRQLRTCRTAMLRLSHDYAALKTSADTAASEVERLREKNRELNRRTQSAASEARKQYAKEVWGDSRHRKPLWKVGKLLGVEIDGKSWFEVEMEIVKAIEKLTHPPRVVCETPHPSVAAPVAETFVPDGYYSLVLKQEDTTLRIELSSKGTVDLTMQQGEHSSQVHIHPRRWREMVSTLNNRHFPLPSRDEGESNV